MNVAFRVDASDRIGTGHVMRCLGLARALSATGAVSTFVTRERPGYLADLIAARGHGCRILPATTAPTPRSHADWLGVDWRDDARQTLEALDGSEPVDLLVVDHYSIDQKWEAFVRPKAKRIAVFDDLADRRHDADLLIDQTLGRDPADYQGLIPDGCTVVTGPQYAALRPEFATARPVALKRRQEFRGVGRVSIALGGTNTESVTRTLIGLFGDPSVPRVELDIVLGRASDTETSAVRSAFDAAGLRGRVDGFSDSMAEAFVQADVAIGAAGTTSWERCCLGLPTLCIILAENQRQVGAALLQADAILDCVDPETLAIGHIRSLVEIDAGRYDTISSNAAEVCDGRGAQRIADVIGELCST